jgi:hypothetical protein
MIVQNHQITDWMPWVALQHARRVGPRHVQALSDAFDGDLAGAGRRRPLSSAQSSARG